MSLTISLSNIPDTILWDSFLLYYFPTDLDNKHYLPHFLHKPCSQYIQHYQWKMLSLCVLSLFCDFHYLVWFGNVPLKNLNSYLRKKSAHWKWIKCITKISWEVFNVPCLPGFLQKPLLSVVSYNKGRTKFLDVNWRKKSCLQFLSIAPLPRQAGLQPEASRQNLTATLQNVSSSYQCIHNS